MEVAGNIEHSKNNVSFGKGVAWLALSHALIRVFAFASGIVTARFLMPNDFGIISMAATITGFIEYLNDMGIEAFLISRKDIDYKKTNTVYLVNMLIGLFFTLSILLFAPIAANFYHSEEVKTVLQITGFTFIISAIISIPKIIIMKDMRQDIISKVKLMGGFSRSLFTILFAIIGFKYLSYAIPVLLSFIIMMLIYIKISRWKYSLNFDFSILKDIYKYSKSFMPKSLLTYLILNSDYIIVGYLLGKEILGYYYFGFEKAFLVFAIIMGVGVNAYMPLFSKKQTDKQELIKTFFNIVEKQAFILYPIFFLQVILANELITIVYGTRWINSILTFELLVGVLFTKSLMTIINNFFDAIGKPKVNLKLTAMVTPLLIISFFIGAKTGGLTGVSIAAFISHNLSAFIAFIIFSREMKIKLNAVFNVCLKIFIPLLIQLPIILPLKWLLIYLHFPKIAMVIIISVIIFALYLFWAKLFIREIYEGTFISILKKVFKKTEFNNKEKIN